MGLHAYLAWQLRRTHFWIIAAGEPSPGRRFGQLEIQSRRRRGQYRSGELALGLREGGLLD